MNKNLENLAKDLDKVRSNYVPLSVLEDLLIDFSNKKEALKKIATLRITPQKELVIRSFEQKNIPFITKSILSAQLGYSLAKTENEEAYFSLIPLSEESRRKLIKKVEELVEGGRIALRNSRQKIRDHLKKAKKNKELSESEERLAEKVLKEITSGYLRKVDELKTKKIRSMEMR